jgi:hypothetical protein
MTGLTEAERAQVEHMWPTFEYDPNPRLSSFVLLVRAAEDILAGVVRSRCSAITEP